MSCRVVIDELVAGLEKVVSDVIDVDFFLRVHGMKQI